jgi:putative polyhydroxyalkanoate system protein
MSVITIRRKHQFSLDELKQKIDQIVLEISNKLEVRSEWESENTLLFRRKGANGCIEVDNSNFELTLKLGMMFRMMKGSIQREMTEVVDEHIK